MKPVIGHEAIVRELGVLAMQPDPPHALLLAGPEGTGRRRLALEYSRLLNCERASHPPAASPAGTRDDIPCGECRACRLIAAEGHPDVIVLGPGDTLCKARPGESGHAEHPQSRDIRICQVRGVVDLVSRFPVEARYRVIIIDPAERLREEAANTLLKTLEEPPGHSVFVLITGAPEALLETVRSRCRRIDVRPVGRLTIEAGLRAHGVPPDEATLAAEAARGRPGRGITFAARPDLIGDRERLLDRCRRLTEEGLTERFRYSERLVDRYRRDRGDVARELDVWEEFWETQMRADAREGTPRDTLGASEALRAIGRAREDLLANVQARPALDLMLMSFPRRTLASALPEDNTTSDG